MILTRSKNLWIINSKENNIRYVNNPMKERLRFSARVVSYVIRGGCLVHVLQSQFYEFTETRGESMLPTLQANNDFVLSSKYYRNGRGVAKGDCIVALKPTDPTQRVCKRITGMPGDLVLVDPSLNNDGVSTNEESMNKYIEVPKGHCWITGDNLAHSLDSRSYNSLPLGLIKGKILAATDFNKSFWEDGAVFGFRWVGNNYIDEEEEQP